MKEFDRKVDEFDKKAIIDPRSTRRATVAGCGLRVAKTVYGTRINAERADKTANK